VGSSCEALGAFGGKNATSYAKREQEEKAM